MRSWGLLSICRSIAGGGGVCMTRMGGSIACRMRTTLGAGRAIFCRKGWGGGRTRLDRSRYFPIGGGEVESREPHLHFQRNSPMKLRSLQARHHAAIAFACLAGFAGVARAADYPPRKPGLWEMKMAVDGKAAMPAMVTQQCIDAGSDQAMRE